MAERLRTSAVAAPGSVANSSGSMLPTTSSTLGNFFTQANPNMGPLFQPDDPRGKNVLLRILAEFSIRQKRPLPPALTGMPTPTWNPAASTFRFELGAERGVVKIAGQDVDLFKLWQAIFHAGLLGKVSLSALRFVQYS
jgi:SWI/SNF chromatin-remodeling complex subunit SWI1